jgi:hypothetical protein
MASVTGIEKLLGSLHERDRWNGWTVAAGGASHERRSAMLTDGCFPQQLHRYV